MSEGDELLQKTIAARYRLVRVVGVGAMGCVYEARDGFRDETQESIALKALSHEDEESRARFKREITLSASLSHPNVVPVLDHGIDDAIDLHFYTMPLYQSDLGLELAKRSILAEAVAVPLMVQACRGVEAAHERGIVHRDVKPSNLFLETTHTGVLSLKVADFGLAKGDEKSITRSGAMLGTLTYIAPEQAVSPKSVDARADVWSLGMVLYHALSGAPAFTQAGTFMSFLVKKGAQVPPLQDSAPWVSPRLARAVHAALLRDPESRWPSVSELVLGLQTAVGFDAAERETRAADLDMPVNRGQVNERAILPTHWEDLLRG